MRKITPVIFIWPFKNQFFIWLTLIFLSCNPDKPKEKSNFSNRLKLNYGITKDKQNTYVYLDSSSVQRFLIVENPHINKLLLIQKSNHDSILTGDSYPFIQRKIMNRFFVFPIYPSSVRDTLNLIFDKSGENLSYTLRILSEEKYKLYERNDNLVIGIIVGFYCLAFVIVILLFLYYRSIKILLFLLYIFFSLLWILNDAGVLFQYLWPNWPVWHNSTRGFLSSLTIILFALYIRENKNKIFNQNIIRVVLVIIVSLGIKFLTTFLLAKGIFPENLKYAASHINGIILLLLFSTVSFFILLEIKKHKDDLFEMLAILTYCLFVMSLSFRELGLSFLILEGIHQLQALPFFLVQLIFMSIHLFKLEESTKKERELAFIEFKINQQRQTDMRILEVEENEKRRIAQNIHDEIGGIFVAIKYKALTIQEKMIKVLSEVNLQDLIELSNQGIKKQYSIIDDLLFEINDKKTFLTHLKDHLHLILVNQNIRTNLIFETDEDRWTYFQKKQLFRIISELITNTNKHTKASIIDIHIFGYDHIQFHYSDNGPGYDISSVKKGNGITNIISRVNAMNGNISFSNQNRQTRVEIEILLSNE
jgi:signal transduction histidine kinase